MIDNVQICVSMMFGIVFDITFFKESAMSKVPAARRDELAREAEVSGQANLKSQITDLKSPPYAPRSALAANLPVNQTTCLEELLSGKNVSDAAQAAGVSRMTVYRWLNDNPAFRAAYNQWHAQVKFHARSRLLALSDAAVSAVQKALETGDAKLGLTILKSIGVLKEQEAGISDPEQVARRMDIDARRREIVLRHAQECVEDDEDSLRPRNAEEWAQRNDPAGTGE